MPTYIKRVGISMEFDAKISWWRGIAIFTAAIAAAGVLLLAGQGGAAPEFARAGDRDVRVVAVGDVACAPGAAETATRCRHGDVAALVKRLRPSELLLPGDLQYDVGALASFRASYDVAFGKFRQISRPAPGNHEYGTPGAAGYYEYFGSRAGPERRGWYSFNAGGWHFVSLNSNCDVVDCSARSRQARWLRNDLARARSQCTVAMWHHPLVSSNNHGNNPAVAPLWRELRRARVEILLAGHDHGYERFSPLASDGSTVRSGPREFVVGTGGRSVYPFGAAKPGSVSRVAAFGALALDVRPGRAQWRFVSTGGEVLDDGAIRCH